MMIKQLRLDGFLSFAPGSEPLEMRPLNVLIGPNGAGKSNVLEAFELIAATPHDLAAAIRASGGSANLLWKGKPEAREAEIDVVLDRGGTPMKRDMRYRMSFAPVAGRMKLLDEAIEECTPQPGEDDVYFYYRFQRGDPVLNLRSAEGGLLRPRRLRREGLLPDQSVLSQRKDPDQYPEITWLGSRLPAIQFFTEWTFGRYTPVRRVQDTALPENQLLPDSRNLALVVNHIELEGETQIEALLKEFFPRFERLRVGIRAGTAELRWFESGFRAPIPAARLSDGTLRFLALLATLLSPSPPPLLCVDEPELGLHPDSIALLAEVFVDASTRTQLVVTTHSDTLVSALSDQPEAVVVCERPGASTALRRLEPERLASWLDAYRLGDLWGMGVLGGNP